MIPFILLQLFPLGLTGVYHTDPLYNNTGPRNIHILSTVTPKDVTRVMYKKNCGRIVDHGNTEDGWYYFITVENDSTLNK